MASIRWAFKCTSWEPSRAEWMLAARCVQPEEKTRIGRFMFQRDSKFAMIGRLMIRKVLSEQLSIPWKDIKLSRTEKGKPIVENIDTNAEFSFNVSHQGDYTVIAADKAKSIGVDVMDYERPRGKRSLDEYFEMMDRQLTAQEWDFIKSGSTEEIKLARFYRFWCLKESYVKALGIGIGFKLKRLDFHVNCPELREDQVTSSTTLEVDGEPVEGWVIQESYLDDHHCAATAITDYKTKPDDEEGLFKKLTFEELVTNAEPITDPDEEYWEAFKAKQLKPNRKK